jgi:hypothetical protein
MHKAVAVLLVSWMAAQPVLADDSAKLLGTWKLVSFETEFQDGRPSRPVYGAKPTGYLLYTPQRMMTLIEGEGRQPGKTVEERAALMATMIAWTGAYRLEGDKHILKVDAAWNPALNGTERVATFKLEGNRLHFTSPWAPALNLPGSPMTRGITVWERGQ